MFQTKKSRILAQLSLPDSHYKDRSPKGSVDLGIRDLISRINQEPGLVTTSSCAGRISVYLDGRKHAAATNDGNVSASSGTGGKGGGRWLFVSHERVPIPSKGDSVHPVHSLFGLRTRSGTESGHPSAPLEAPLVHLKFEAMILHVFTESLADAQRVVAAAVPAGFRESGAINLDASSDGTITPTVAVRSNGLGFDSVIGFATEDGDCVSIVDEAYLQTLVALANHRFGLNAHRKARFETLLFSAPPPSTNSHAMPEEASARRARMREEGLARQQELQQQQKSTWNDRIDALDEDVGSDALYGVVNLDQ